MVRSSVMTTAAPVPASPRASAPEGDLPSARQRTLRALGVVLVWALAAAPAGLGAQQCTFARAFHAPCPGCGMTRAVRLLLAGDVRGSLHMHALAVPVLLAWGAFALSTVWATYRFGYPLIHRTRSGRAAIALLVVTYAASLALWALRWMGHFGGPVPVY